MRTPASSVCGHVPSRRRLADAVLHCATLQGAFVVSYPLDGTASGAAAYAAAQDDETLRFLARTYASRHPVVGAAAGAPGVAALGWSCRCCVRCCVRSHLCMDLVAALSCAPTRT